MAGSNLARTMNIDEQTVTTSKVCSVTGELYSVTVPFEQYRSWKDGMLSQRAMPQLSADEREFVMSGTTPKEWEQIFPLEDDEF
jgi:hypothetical protein